MGNRSVGVGEKKLKNGDCGLWMRWRGSWKGGWMGLEFVGGCRKELRWVGRKEEW